MKKRIWLVLSVLILASLACSLGGGASEDVTEEATQPPASGGEEQETTAPDSGGGEEESEAGPALELDADVLSNLDSYRMHIAWTWTPDSGVGISAEMFQEATRDPAAQRMTMTSSEAPDQSIEWVQIDATTWLCSNGSCMQTEQTGEDALSGFGEGMEMAPEDIADMTEGSEYRFVGQEEVNGINTNHYELTLSAAQAAAMTQSAEVTDFSADIWVADEADLPHFAVRTEMSWTGTSEGVSGQGEMLMEVYDVNAAFTIEPPEGAGAGFPENVPEYPNASGLTMMEGFISFTVTDDVATVADYYRNELAAIGWTLESDDDLGGMIMQSWNLSGQSLSLMVSPGDSGTSVVISITTE